MCSPILSVGLLASTLASVAVAQSATSFVWPLHGSSGADGIGGWASSEIPVGATRPFCALRLGPDTTVCWAGVDWWWPYNHYGGYFYNDSCVRAFSHSHAQGAGLGDGGSLGIMVTRTSPSSSNGSNGTSVPSTLNPSPYRSSFSHAEAGETSVPGYYSVWLSDASALAELTATGSHSGLHRYTCTPAPGAAVCTLWFDACHRNWEGNDCGKGALDVALAGTPGNATSSASLFLNASLMENGSFGGDCGGVPIFLSAIITAADGSSPQLVGMWADGAYLAPAVRNASSTGASNSLGAYASWTTLGSSTNVTINVRIGVSYVSQEAAAQNLAAQQPNYTAPSAFEDAVTASDAEWEAVLSSIVINSVGYTQEDYEAHQASPAVLDASLDSHMDSLHRVPGRAPSQEGLERAWELASGLLRDLASKQKSAPSSRLLDAESGNAAAAQMAARRPELRFTGPQYEDVNAAVNQSLLRHRFPVPLPITATAPFPLGIPAHPRGLPPAERVASFYSSLYHALSAPTIYSDVDGSYRGLDGAIHSTSAAQGGWGGNFLSDLSLWDVYRSQTPLLSLLAPTVASDLFASMVADFNATGRTPHWVFANCETGVMPGSHGLAVLADFLIKGVPGATAQQVYAIALAALNDQDKIDGYDTIGYVPLDASTNAASLTLDYAFDDACGAVIADLAGEAAQAAIWWNRSQAYRYLWNAVPGALCPRYSNGSFLEPCPPLDLPPILLNSYYTEGDGLQYTWSVPHDVEGLRSLFPSDAAYISLLQQMMVNTTMWPTNAIPNPWYWAGNEPGVLAPWQFSLVPTDAWRTQYWLRWILDNYYPLTPDGVPGNDDFGELNAWAVWACLGLYPLTATPGGTYILSSPCFANTTMTFGPSATLNIVAHNYSLANIYVARASLNGVDLPTPFVNHSALFARATISMSAQEEEEEDVAVKPLKSLPKRVKATSNLLEYWLTNTPMVWGTGEPAPIPDW